MSRRLIAPWLVRTILGLAGVACGAGIATALGGGGVTPGALVALLFGLAVLTGFAKTGTP